VVICFEATSVSFPPYDGVWVGANRTRLEATHTPREVVCRPCLLFRVAVLFHWLMTLLSGAGCGDNMLIAVKRKRLGRKLITLGNGHQYVFSTKVNLNIAWVEEEDIEVILAIKESCCGGRRKPGYVLPAESEMYKWNNA